MLKFSKKQSLTRDIMPMLDMSHLMRPIYSFPLSILLTLDGKPILANYKGTMPNTDPTATLLILPKLQKLQTMKLRRSYSRIIKPLQVHGRKPRNSNHMPPLTPSQTPNYQRISTGEISKESTSLTHIEIKAIVDLAILCLLLRSLR